MVIIKSNTSKLKAIAGIESIDAGDRAFKSGTKTFYLSNINKDAQQTVVEQSVSLSAVTEMHDRLIVATAIVLENQGATVKLLTCDRNITASALLTFVW
jgi:hypothetical protein